MKVIFRFKKFIAVGQKTKESPTFGMGFNYWVEAGFCLDPQLTHEKCLRVFDEVLSGLDHKALDVDIKLGFEPTSARLCLYIQEQISRKLDGAEVQIQMLRGDGAQFSVG